MFKADKVEINNENQKSMKISCSYSRQISKPNIAMGD